MSSTTDLDLVVIGAIAGAHGVKGDAKLRAFGDPGALCTYGPFLDKAGKVILTPVRGRHSGGETVIAAFKEAVTREQLIAMKGTLLHAPRAALPEPDEDEFYHTDLIGLAVERADGAPMGRIKAVHDFGAGDILEVSGSEGVIYLPFTKAAVPVVDIKGGRVIADPPDELIAGGPETG
jgi:16S rRNA processing protein RimM